MLLPAQEQFDRDMVRSLTVRELGELAQDPFRERQVVAETAPGGDVFLEAYS